MTKGKLCDGEDEDQMGFTTCAALEAVFECCLEELSILLTVFKEVERESYGQLYQYISPDLRFTTTPKELKRFEEEVYESIPYTNAQKLKGDVAFLCTTLRETCTEISRLGCFETLKQVIDGFEKEESENEAISTEHRQNISEIIRLKGQVKIERKSFRSQLMVSEKEIIDLEDRYQEILGDGKRQLSYVTSWENARVDQNTLKLTMVETVYTDQINFYLSKLDAEERVHGEIHNFIDENVQDLKNGIQYWMERYDKDVERLDSAILKMRMRWQELETQYAELEQVLELAKAKVDRLLLEKEEKRKQIELLALQNRAAVIIQTWWRKVMMERHLGPYKLKGKKGKGKKEKGKK